MGRLIRQLFCLLPIIVLSASAVVQAQTEDVPYIYYYSDRLNAFIIERADGTDTRLLGSGLMLLTEQQYYGFEIDGPGWSPSGRWFAWTAGQVSYNGPSRFRPYILSADGTQRLTMLDNLEDVRMAWSPSSDLLLVESPFHDNQPTQPILKRLVALINPATNTMITLNNDTLAQFDASPSMVRWTNNGYGVAEYTTTPLDSSTLRRTGFTVVDKFGKATQRQHDNVLYDDGYPSEPATSANGYIAYLTDESLVVENVITGDQTEFDKPAGKRLRVHWSSNGKYGLIMGHDLWLIEPNAGTLQLVQSLFSPPDDVFISEQTQPLWSPDNAHALFVSSDKLYWLQAAAGKATQVPNYVHKDYSVDLQWRWAVDGRVIIGTPKAISVYDSSLKPIKEIQLDGFSLSIESFGQFDMTTDGDYLAYMQEGPVIYRAADDRITYLRPAAEGFDSAPGGEVRWSKNNKWLLTFDDALVAGGGYVRFLGIVRADSTMQRDLSYAISPSDTTINWLPPQVNPANLPAPLKRTLFPRPIKTLHGSNWLFVLSWSPDAKQIAGSGGGWANDSRIIQWDVTTGHSAKIDKPNKDLTNYHIDWQADSNGKYKPMLTPMPTFPTLQGRDVGAISPDGRQAFVVTSKGDEPAGIYDVNTGKLIHQIENGAGYYTWASYSPDGQLLVVSTKYDPAKIYATKTWEKVGQLPFAAPAVEFSPDGKQLAATNAWDVDIWSIEDLLALH